MSVSQRHTNNETHNAPDGWHWGMGNSSSTHYTHWLYTNKVLYQDGAFGWECQIYHDNDGPHYVEFIQITKIKRNGDYEYGYPVHTDSFDSEEAALKYAIKKATELR